MAKPKKPTKDQPPKVTEDEALGDLPELSKGDDQPTAASETTESTPKDPDPTLSDAADKAQPSQEAETVVAPEPLDERAEGFVWVDSDEKDATQEGRMGEDSIEGQDVADPDTVVAETDAGTVEAVEDTDPEPKESDEVKPEELPPPPPAAPQRTTSFWPAVFGGIVAALLGFIAGRGDMLDAYLPGAAAPEPVDLAPLNSELAALSERLGALETAETPEMPEIPDLSADLGGLSQSLASVETALQSVTTRLEELEARPVADPVAPPPDNSEELAALQSSIEELEARLAEEDARASAEAERILARAALTRVITAVETGEAFEPALGALEEVTPVEVPEALRTAALEGVPTVSALRESFPEAARAALAAARAEVPESEVDGLGGFLRRQLSARSVTPREGSDPDAVLSRAEAALRAGDLDAALAETEALPDAAKTAMQDWLAGATARKAAGDAAKALSDSLTVN
ncbi:COG4223 family protein [Roseobacter sinensis]|uniref:Mitochondrial inner membrane protein n=1 Tax=Roseobacter sinensis TaxID=2931391 RepID=A0ABT3B8S8_9RHOB|nr:hypothetical protein [Roseobacter sp. WL0113]MCV3269974.1 hypothetical protein [Roseobacter sp. WL0113]